MAHAPRVPGRKKWRVYFKVLFPSLVALLVGFLVVVGYISYLIIFPKVSVEGNPAYYSLLQYKEMPVPYSGGAAWFLAGEPHAPAVFLCHDYGFNRLSTLNLANLLHDQGYNLFILSFRGHAGKSSVPTSLGLLEGADLATTIDQALASRSGGRDTGGCLGRRAGRTCRAPGGTGRLTNQSARPRFPVWLCLRLSRISSDQEDRVQEQDIRRIGRARLGGLFHEDSLLDLRGAETPGLEWTFGALRGRRGIARPLSVDSATP